jgi:putative PIN family toxin of toxin-antitoxin system
LQAVLAGEIDVVISWELAAELRDVLRRPKLRRYAIAEEDVRDLIGLIAADLPTVDVEVELRDSDDIPVVAAALAGRAAAIVTGDRDLLDDAALRIWLAEREVEVLTPAELAGRI